MGVPKIISELLPQLKTYIMSHTLIVRTSIFTLTNIEVIQQKLNREMQELKKCHKLNEPSRYL